MEKYEKNMKKYESQMQSSSVAMNIIRVVGKDYDTVIEARQKH